jgi:uncharacterized membrane protein YdjX (TVP38/TMEM64 family)
MRSPKKTTLAKQACLVVVVMALVCVPFVVFGQEFAVPWLKSVEQRAGLLASLSILLLAADALAPVPSTLVIMFLAANAGTLVGILASTVGLCAGVLTAAWFGRVAVGRLAPRFISETELARLRDNLQSRLALTLACWRAVPVMAETTVILAAATGVPIRKIFLATLLPNLLVAVIYSVAADDSFVTASIAFFATLIASALLWWIMTRWQKPSVSV